MEYIKNGYVYHIVTNRLMTVGQELTFGNTHNSIYNNVMNLEFLNEKGEDSLDIILQTKMENLSNEQKRIIFKHIYETAMIMREYVLENVRKEFYPDYPSRFSCLYCVRNLDEADAWLEVFNRTGKKALQIVKMKVSGKIFYGDGNKILRDAKNLNYKINLAKEYWKESLQSSLPECLFEGQAEVVEVVKTFE